jgi:hypothetical protein
MHFYYKEFFDFDTIDLMTQQGLTVDGTGGGFLLGEPHSNNGIPVLVKYLDGYRFMAEFEGQEYLLNPGATGQFIDRLYKINNPEQDEKLNLQEPDNFEGITTIDCRIINLKCKSKLLLLDARGSQFVINKYSTWKNISLLEEMNRVVSWKFLGAPFKWEGVSPT